jgi:hypothetical protein
MSETMNDPWVPLKKVSQGYYVLVVELVVDVPLDK